MSKPTDHSTATPATESDEYSVPASETAVVCEYCGAPFAEEQYRALHWGRSHVELLTDEQRTAYQEAAETEQQSLRLFRLKALGVLILLYFGLVMTYAVVT